MFPYLFSDNTELASPSQYKPIQILNWGLPSVEPPRYRALNSKLQIENLKFDVCNLTSTIFCASIISVAVFNEPQAH